MLGAPAENAAYKSVLEEFNDVTKSKAVKGTVTEKKEKEESERDWKWTETEDEVEVIVQLPVGVNAKQLKVDFAARTLKVTLRTETSKPLVAINLFQAVRPDACSWTMGTGGSGAHILVTMEKVVAETWERLETRT